MKERLQNEFENADFCLHERAVCNILKIKLTGNAFSFQKKHATICGARYKKRVGDTQDIVFDLEDTTMVYIIKKDWHQKKNSTRRRSSVP